MKAFRIITEGFPDGICFDLSASKARYKAKLSSDEAGYMLGFDEIKVIRASEYDESTICGRVPYEGEIIIERYIDEYECE